jgi:hypothetical protein
MAEPAENPNASAVPPKMPFWVKVMGIILIVVVLLVGIVLISGGEHGPGRHMPVQPSTEQP